MPEMSYCPWQKKVGQSCRGTGCRSSVEYIAATSRASLRPTSQPPPSHPRRIRPHTPSTPKYQANDDLSCQQPLGQACRKSSPLTSTSLTFPFTFPLIKRESKPQFLIVYNTIRKSLKVNDF